MDAVIMDGKDLKTGAVAAVQNIKNPIQLARKVMTQVSPQLTEFTYELFHVLSALYTFKITIYVCTALHTRVISEQTIRTGF